MNCIFGDGQTALQWRVIEWIVTAPRLRTTAHSFYSVTALVPLNVALQGTNARQLWWGRLEWRDWKTKARNAPRKMSMSFLNKQNPGASSSEGDYTHPHLNCLGDNYVNSFFPQSICYTCLQLSIKINWMIDGLKTQDIRLHYKIISFLSTVKLRVTTLAI